MLAMLNLMNRPAIVSEHPRLSRRAMLQAGAIGLLGLGQNHLSMLQAAAREAGVTAAAPGGRAKSVIYIFLSGGLAQHETFDMKPDAPIEIRGEFKPISTRTPGLQICEHLPELAKRSPLWAVCRSLTHRWNEHSQGHHIMLTGRIVSRCANESDNLIKTGRLSCQPPSSTFSWGSNAADRSRRFGPGSLASASSRPWSTR